MIHQDAPFIETRTAPRKAQKRNDSIREQHNENTNTISTLRTEEMKNSLWEKYSELLDHHPDLFNLEQITINLKDLQEYLANGNSAAYELFDAFESIRQDEVEQAMGFRGVPRVFLTQLLLLSNEYRELRGSLTKVKSTNFPSDKTLTSVNSPLRIATFVPKGISGKIGITLCPGKKQAHSMSGSFDRDLGMDLDIIKTWGASAVVTLMEDSELVKYQVSEIRNEVEARGMQWYHLPIINGDIPDDEFEQSWKYSGLRLRQLLKNGQHVVIHCGGGLGRSGTIAARLGVELGMSPQLAITSVRTVRKGAIENSRQERFIHACTPIDTDNE